MSIRGIDHIVLHVRDIEATLTFYRRLGLEVLWEEEWRRYESHYPVLRVNETQTIHLLTQERSATISPANPKPGGAHLCLWWDGPASEIAALLKQLNLTPEIGPAGRRGGQGQGTSYYFRDPDHNLIELLTYHAPEISITPLSQEAAIDKDEA